MERDLNGGKQGSVFRKHNHGYFGHYRRRKLRCCRKAVYKANGARATGTADYQPKITMQTVSLSGSWIGSGPYYQTILTGQSAGLQVNLNPTIEQLTALGEAGVTSMVAANENGTVKIYAAGAAPAAMSLQITKIMTY